MKKITALIAAIILKLTAQAQVPISALPSATGDLRNGVLPIVINGATRKATPLQLSIFDSIHVTQGTTYDTMWVMKGGVKLYPKLIRSGTAGTSYTAGVGVKIQSGEIKLADTLFQNYNLMPLGNIKYSIGTSGYQNFTSNFDFTNTWGNSFIELDNSIGTITLRSTNQNGFPPNPAELQLNGLQRTTGPFAGVLRPYSYLRGLRGSYIMHNFGPGIGSIEDSIRIFGANHQLTYNYGNGFSPDYQYNHSSATLTNYDLLAINKYSGALVRFTGSLGGGSGTVNSGAQYRLPYYASAGTTLSPLPAITGNRALTSDANGLPTHSNATTSDLNNISGLTGNVQTQINNLKNSLDSVKPVRIDSTYRAAAYISNTSGELTILSDSIGSTDNKISVAFSGDTTKRRWLLTLNEANLTLGQSQITGLVSALSGKQGNITFQDEGSGQGSAGANTTINFTGAGVTASNSGSVLTVNIPGAGGGSPLTTTDNNLSIASDVLTMRKTPLTLTDGATITWNAATGYNARVVLGGNRTLSITNPQNGQFGTLTVVQDATGSRRLTVPNGTIIVTPVPNDSTVVQWYYENGAFKWSAPEIGGTVFLASDVANSNATANTMADVTGLSFPVYSGYLYEFEFIIEYNSAATTTGSRWAINGPTTTFLTYKSYYTLTATTETINYASAYDIPAASNATSLTTGNIATIKGKIRPSAAGTVIARFASEVSSSAVTALGTYSYVRWRIVNQY